MAQPRTRSAKPALFGGHVAVAVLALSALHGLPLVRSPGWVTAPAPALAIAGPPVTRRMPAQRRSAPLLDAAAD